MHRLVEPEMLDALPARHHLAIGSRADLHRVNRVMGNAEVLAHAFDEHFPTQHDQPLRIADLGAGDGLITLDVARLSSGVIPNVQLTLVDRHNVVTPETLSAFTELGWRTTLTESTAHDWLKSLTSSIDVIFVNLLLHQFPDDELRTLLQLAASRTRLFIACEPRRTSFALAASRCLWLAGCNKVSRNDGPISVRAGFAGAELSALWPNDPHWHKAESPAGLFNHRFVAARNYPQTGTTT